MASTTVDKEILYRASLDEYGTVHLQRVVRITDDEGQSTERLWRAAITPDDDFPALAAGWNLGAGATTRLTAIVQAARYPEAVARFEARKAEQADILP